MIAPSGKMWRADLALVGVTIIWGTTFVVVKSALDDVSAVLFLALRFTLAAGVLALLFRARLLQVSGLLAGLLAGVFLFASYVFQTVGLRLTTPAKSAFITGLAIPMVPLLNSLVYRVRPRVAEVFGILLATIGLTLMTLRVETLDFERGDVITLGCAFGFAAHIIIVGHYTGAVRFEALSFSQVAFAALLAGISYQWIETPLIRWSFGIYVAIVITGLFATALAFTVQAWAQQYTSATRAALIFALEPVIAWVTSYLAIGETLSFQGIAGAGLILAGILLVELKPTLFGQHPSK